MNFIDTAGKNVPRYSFLANALPWVTFLAFVGVDFVAKAIHFLLRLLLIPLGRIGAVLIAGFGITMLSNPPLLDKPAQGVTVFAIVATLLLLSAAKWHR